MKRLLTVLILLAAHVAGATNYYVDAAAGTDTNTGLSEGAAWLTIGKAFTNLYPGDAAYFASGDYGVRATSVRSGTSLPIAFFGQGIATVSGFRLKHSGIHIRGWVIDGESVGSQDGAIDIYSNADNCVIANCTISSSLSGTNAFGLNTVYSTIPAYGPTNVLVVSNLISDTGYHAVKVRGAFWTLSKNYFDFCNGWDCINIWGEGHTIADNAFTNISHEEGNDNHVDIIQSYGSANQLCWNIVVERNKILNSDGQGFRVEDNGRLGNYGWTFRNNLFSEIEHVALETGVSNCYVYNNTFWNCTTSTSHAVTFFGSNGVNGAVKNNIFAGCGSQNSTNTAGWYNVDLSNSLDYDFNFVCGNGPSYPAKATSGTWAFSFHDTNGVNGGDPQFVDEASGNLQVQSDSPCVLKGVALAAVPSDMLGVTRHATPTIGCYEYPTTISHPTRIGLKLTLPPEPVVGPTYNTNILIALNFDNAADCQVGIVTSAPPCGWAFNPILSTNTVWPKWTNEPNAMVFDGTDNIGTWPSNDTFTLIGVPWAFSAWIKSATWSTNSTYKIASGGFNGTETWVLKRTDAPLTNRMYLNVVEAGGSSKLLYGETSVWTNDSWYHVAGGWDATSRFIFVNGNLEGSVADTNGIAKFVQANEWDQFCLGGLGYWRTNNDGEVYYATSDRFKGRMSKVRFWYNYAYSQTDCTAEVEAGP